MSVAIQYGNAFGQGMQAAALKPADFFGNDDVLYLMEDMATGEIRLSILWEWLHKGAKLTAADEETGVKDGDAFTRELCDRLLIEEYAKLLTANSRDVHDNSKTTTLPIAREIVEAYLRGDTKLPWYIDLLNITLGNHDLNEAQAPHQIASGRIFCRRYANYRKPRLLTPPLVRQSPSGFVPGTNPESADQASVAVGAWHQRRLRLLWQEQGVADVLGDRQAAGVVADETSGMPRVRRHVDDITLARDERFLAFEGVADFS